MSTAKAGQRRKIEQGSPILPLTYEVENEEKHDSVAGLSATVSSRGFVRCASSLDAVFTPLVIADGDVVGGVVVAGATIAPPADDVGNSLEHHRPPGDDVPGMPPSLWSPTI